MARHRGGAEKKAVGYISLELGDVRAWMLEIWVASACSWC